MPSFDDTLLLAGFVLSDRRVHKFTRLRSERAFRSHVRERFWNEARQRGGWDNRKVYAVVRRNRLACNPRVRVASARQSERLRWTLRQLGETPPWNSW
jgi:hypothetical protein